MSEVIPAEAVEAAAKGIFDARDDPYDLDEWEDLDSIAREPYVCHARTALEAAAPILLSHEREQTRLAHLDAMVNRETKREELAAEYRRGYRDGLIDRKQVTADAVESSPVMHVGMRAYIWVDAFGMWQDGVWDGNVWRVADGDTVENRHVSKWLIQGAIDV